jgi:hypothetical protein
LAKSSIISCISASQHPRSADCCSGYVHGRCSLAGVGCSESLIYQICDEKRLTHYRVGGRGRRGKILIDPRDLDRFLAENRVDAR